MILVTPDFIYIYILHVPKLRPVPCMDANGYIHVELKTCLMVVDFKFTEL